MAKVGKMISAGIVIIHIFVHWLVGIYKKGRVLTEEIKNSCLTNVLEFVLCIFLMRNLWFIHEFRLDGTQNLN